MSSHYIGKYHEQAARAYLEQHKLQLIQANYRTKFGEIDLIMRDSVHTVIFIEVRFRKNTLFGDAQESITIAKQQKIIKTANHFLQQATISHTSCRFDAIYKNGTNGHWHWIQNAFSM